MKRAEVRDAEKTAREAEFAEELESAKVTC